MTSVYLVASIAIMITMGLGLTHAVLGRTVFDRILAVNMFGTKAVLLVSVFAFFSGRPDVLDIALLYSLLNFVGVVAALRLVEQGTFFADSKQRVGKKNAAETNERNTGAREKNAG